LSVAPGFCASALPAAIKAYNINAVQKLRIMVVLPRTFNSYRPSYDGVVLTIVEYYFNDR
jgi:hypothetical protein